jgi:hypothetical protein
MGALSLGLLAGSGLTQPAAAQTPAIEWNRTYGGRIGDFLTDVIRSSDGGFVLSGQSESKVSGDRTVPGNGFSDYWLLKLAANGTKRWDRAYGGNVHQSPNRVRQLADGSYVLAGYSLSGISGDKSEPNFGDYDYWVIKTDSLGNKLWDKTVGGNGFDILVGMQPTADGGYLLAGYSPSVVSGNKTAPNLGDLDYWLVKLDAQGNKQWDRTLGGSQSDAALDLIRTKDGGFLVGGTSSSGISATKSQASRGQGDYWIIKLDALSAPQWDRAFGGSGDDVLNRLCPTADGGYLLGGTSASGVSADKSEPSRGKTDYWLVKLDAQGTKQWDRTFGGNEDDDLRDAVQTSDGGYAVSGDSYSGVSGDHSQPNQGGADWWLLKLDAQGAPQWSRALGGNRDERRSHLLQTPDGGFLVAGSSLSGISGDKTEASRGDYDFWVIKLAPMPAPIPSVTPSVFIPNIITPNNDQTNERFVVQGLPAGSWALTVYNRWGRPVFATDNYQHNWGAGVAQGLYYYVLSQPNSSATYKGWLEVAY